MKTTKTTKIARLKGLGKGSLITALGVGLLVGGTTYAGFVDRQAITTEGISTGEASLLLEDEAWALNGRVLAEGEISAVKLGPGDQLKYTATALTKRTVTSSGEGSLKYTGFDEAFLPLANTPGGDLLESFEAKLGAGEQETVVPTGESAAAAEIQFTLKDSVDPIWADGNGKNVPIDLSQIDIVLE